MAHSQTSASDLPVDEIQLGMPVFENVAQDPEFSFCWHCHDFPSPLAKWNYHPEFELHLIRYSRGSYFVGDHVGRFGPGNLVLVGPNLPHAWFSDAERDDGLIRGRDVVLQFRAAWLEHMMTLCPELNCLRPMLRAAVRGLLFEGERAEQGACLLESMGEQPHSRRLLTMLTLLHDLAGGHYRQLASDGYRHQLQGTFSEQIDSVLRHVHNHFSEDLRMSDLAARHDMLPSNFSRLFKRATGNTFVEFLRRVRINQACRLLMEGQYTVSEICFRVGYNNLSNFNRHFRGLKGMTPREYQQYTGEHGDRRRVG
ncbi:helix-turn-helix domain-containing protein [Kushneria sinocarnis]|nr:AraC family transcriptional regulator [Kushneria sinocarnis]